MTLVTTGECTFSRFFARSEARKDSKNFPNSSVSSRDISFPPRLTRDRQYCTYHYSKEHNETRKMQAATRFSDELIIKEPMGRCTGPTRPAGNRAKCGALLYTPRGSEKCPSIINVLLTQLGVHAVIPGTEHVHVAVSESTTVLHNRTTSASTGCILKGLFTGPEAAAAAACSSCS